MDFAECIRQAHPRPHDCVEPSSRSSGEFYRSLDADGALKRFVDDADPPTFGYRLREPHRWRWNNGDSKDGLSVSCAKCLKCTACPVALNPGKYKHAASINLEGLSAILGMNLVAVYTPRPENPYHYLILPVAGPPEDMRSKMKLWMTEMAMHEIKLSNKKTKDPKDEKWNQHKGAFTVYYEPSANTICPAVGSGSLKTSEPLDQ